MKGKKNSPVQNVAVPLSLASLAPSLLPPLSYFLQAFLLPPLLLLPQEVFFLATQSLADDPLSFPLLFFVVFLKLVENFLSLSMLDGASLRTLKKSSKKE